MLDDIENVAFGYLNRQSRACGHSGIFINASEWSRPDFIDFIHGLLGAGRPIHLFEWPPCLGDKYTKRIIDIIIDVCKYDKHYNQAIIADAFIFLYNRVNFYDSNIIHKWIKNLTIFRHNKIIKTLLNIILKHKITIEKFTITNDYSYSPGCLILLSKCIKLDLIKNINEQHIHKYIILYSRYPSPLKIRVLKEFGWWYGQSLHFI